MKCIIIEDEDYAANYLAQQLKACNTAIEIEAIIDTVEGAVAWLSVHKTDLIFSDIQLGDGISFEIFDHLIINTPIIFTTSYDKYAIKAFEQNSIAYLLKPFNKNDLKKALDKYQTLFQVSETINATINTLHTSYQYKFMVQFGNALQTVLADDVAYFLLQNKRYLFIVTQANNQFMYNSSLELLETRLNPQQFFRINRQHIINKNIITQVEQLDRGRMLLHTKPQSKEEFVVSIGRAKAFKEWFAL